MLAGFAATAVLGVTFFQFGVGIARHPNDAVGAVRPDAARGAVTRLAARVLSALGFALACRLDRRARRRRLPPTRGSPGRATERSSARLLLGGVPFALLGIALGYWLPPRAALPVANLIYLPLAVMRCAVGKAGGCCRARLT